MPSIRQQIETLIKATTQPLADLGLALFKEVAGAANLQSILQNRASDPACYIYRLSTQASDNLLDDGLAQVVTAQYGIVVVTRNVADPRHGDSSDTSELYGDAIRGILLGVQLDPYYSPLTYRGGQIISLQNSFLFWQEIYSTQHQQRA